MKRSARDSNRRPQRLVCLFCLFGVLHRFQQCTGHITTGSWKGRGNQYMQFIRVLYCKLPTSGKQLPAFPLEAMPGIEPRPQRWEARVLPLCHCGPPSDVGYENSNCYTTEPPSHTSEIWCIMYTTGDITCGYRHWTKCPCLSNTVQGLYETL